VSLTHIGNQKCFQSEVTKLHSEYEMPTLLRDRKNTFSCWLW